MNADYRNARKVINGLDRADDIAAYARKYESILTASVAEKITPAPDAKADGSPVKAGEAAPDAPAAPGEAIVGGRPGDEAKQVTQGGTISRIIAGVGGGGGLLTAIGGFFSGKTAIIAIGIICATMLFLAIMFRQVLLDWLRLKLGANPTQYNVK